MNSITVDFSKRLGKIKPMHCVNNGPAAQSNDNLEETNFYLYRDLGIPYARNHDASFYAKYGLSHTVDVHSIFTDFSADENDPASYDFTCTDDYIKITELAGTHHFYRLGSKIEHEIKKYGTVMPPDFEKWARICEHIIRHYTEGWADGFYYDMQYWEIWNEPNLDPDDSSNKRCWSGTAADFYRLFRITLDHLKACFPHLKIGGPAVAGLNVQWVRGLLDSLGETKPDFFSWHIYFNKIESLTERAKIWRELLDEYGLGDCESILNEWNYIRDDCWGGVWYDYAIDVRTGPGPKCSAYVAAAMLASQHSSVDMLMLYDARPSGWCSLFKPYHNKTPLKAYYSLQMFNKLYRAGTEVETAVTGEDIYAVGAVGEGESWLMLTHYNDADDTEPKALNLNLRGLGNSGVKLEYYLLDATHSAELASEETVSETELSANLEIPNFTTYLIKIVNL